MDTLYGVYEVVTINNLVQDGTYGTSWVESG